MLAICHFNENLKRETVQTKKGDDHLHVVYPKFNRGEEMVLKIPVPAMYGMLKTCSSCFIPSMKFSVVMPKY